MIYRTGFIDTYKKWLMFLSFLFLLAPNNVPIVNKIIFILLFIVIFSPAIFLKDRELSLFKSEYRFNKNLHLALIVIQFILAEYASRYYTGSGLIESLNGLIKGEGNYYKYQEYFAQNELGSFSFSKIPAIASSAVVKGVFLFCMSSYILAKSDSQKHYFLFFSIIPPLLFSVSRGTFFEVFEVVLCLIYFSLLKGKKVYKFINLKGLKRNLSIIFLAFFLLFLFVLNASQRYADSTLFFSQSCATKDFCFEPYTGFTLLEYPIYLLSTYFSTGIFFITQYITILFEGEVLPSLVPFASTSYTSTDNFTLFKKICTYNIDCGVAWGPELFKWISVFGFLIFLFVFPVSFYFFLKIEKKILNSLNSFSLPLCYLILLYIISIPVGSFYTVSSSNILCSIFFFLLWFSTKKYQRKIY